MEAISIQSLEKPTFTARIPCTFYRCEPVIVTGRGGVPVVCYSIYPTDVAFSD